MSGADGQGLVVVGGGPAGATAAVLAARQGHRVTLIDPLGIGGQLINVELLPDFPGFPGGVAGWDLAAALGEQVLDAGVELLMARADGLAAQPGGGWQVTVESDVLTAAAVLLATGCRPRPLPGAERLEGRGVSYCAACDGGLFAGREVVVVGGGDVAMAEACSLAAVASAVTVLCPDASPTAGAAWLEAIAGRPNVVLRDGVVLEAAREAPDGSLAGLEVVVQATGERLQLAPAGVFGGLEGLANIELLEALDVGAAGEPPGAPTDATFAVIGQPGLFAAGDARAGAFRRAAVAAGEGAAAALSVDAYLTRLR